jgi:hypothetical protein
MSNVYDVPCMDMQDLRGLGRVPNFLLMLQILNPEKEMDTAITGSFISYYMHFSLSLS